MFLKRILLPLLTCWVSSAALIDVQFTSNFNTAAQQSGAAAVGSAGDIWNYFQAGDPTSPGGNPLSGPITSANLVDTTGASTGVGLLATADGAYSSSPGAQGGFCTNATADCNLMNGYIWVGAGHAGEIALSGLVPGAPYDLYLYTQADSGGSGRELTVSVNVGPSFTTTPDIYTTSVFVQGGNYLLLTATANEIGRLKITYSGVPGQGNGEGDVNGLQLSPASPPPSVPEPTTTLTIVAGLGLLVGRYSRSYRHSRW